MLEASAGLDTEMEEMDCEAPFRVDIHGTHYYSHNTDRADNKGWTGSVGSYTGPKKAIIYIKI